MFSENVLRNVSPSYGSAARSFANLVGRTLLTVFDNLFAQSSKMVGNNKDNSIIKGLTHSENPIVRDYMLNIVRGRISGIKDGYLTMSSPLGYATTYLAQNPDEEILRAFNHHIKRTDNHVAANAMATTLINSNNPDYTNTVINEVNNTSSKVRTSLLDAMR